MELKSSMQLAMEKTAPKVVIGKVVRYYQGCFPVGPAGYVDVESAEGVVRCCCYPAGLIEGVRVKLIFEKGKNYPDRNWMILSTPEEVALLKAEAQRKCEERRTAQAYTSSDPVI